MEIRPLAATGLRPRSQPKTHSMNVVSSHVFAEPLHLLYIDALGMTVDMSDVLRTLSRHRAPCEVLSARDYAARCYRQPRWFDTRCDSGLYEDRDRRPKDTGAVFAPPVESGSESSRSGFSARPLPRAAQVFRRAKPTSTPATIRPISRPNSSTGGQHPSPEESPRGNLLPLLHPENSALRTENSTSFLLRHENTSALLRRVDSFRGGKSKSSIFRPSLQHRQLYRRSYSPMGRPFTK